MKRHPKHDEAQSRIGHRLSKPWLRVSIALALLLQAGAMLADPAVVRTLELADAQDLELSPDGATLYVNQWSNPYQIAFVDSATLELLAETPFEGGYHMEMAPDGARLYVSADGGLAVIDTETRLGLPKIPLPSGSGTLTGLAVSPDGSKAFVADRGTTPGLIYVFDLDSSSYDGAIVADAASWPFLTGVDVTPDGSRLYAVSRKYGHLVAVDAVARAQLATIPTSVPGGNILHTVRVDPQGRRAFTTSVQSGTISIVDVDPDSPTYHSQIAAIPTGAAGLSRVAISPDGLRAYVGSNTWTSTGPWELLTIDVDSDSPLYLTILARVAVRANPWGIVPADAGVFVSSWDKDHGGSGELALVGEVGAVPVVHCQGFEAPLDVEPVTVRGRHRALPLKAHLFDVDGGEIDGDALVARPVAQVLFASGEGGVPVDISSDAVAVGLGSESNQFEFAGDHWQLNLKTENLTAPGSYLVSLQSGDDGEYRVADPTCHVVFVRQ